MHSIFLFFVDITCMILHVYSKGIHVFCVTTMTSYRGERVSMPSLREQLANLLNQFNLFSVLTYSFFFPPPYRLKPTRIFLSLRPLILHPLLAPGTHTRAPLCDLLVISPAPREYNAFNVNPALFIILANPSPSTTNRRFTDGQELFAMMRTQ